MLKEGRIALMAPSAEFQRTRSAVREFITVGGRCYRSTIPPVQRRGKFRVRFAHHYNELRRHRWRK